jgi:hypothetical protein
MYLDNLGTARVARDHSEEKSLGMGVQAIEE